MTENSHNYDLLANGEAPSVSATPQLTTLWSFPDRGKWATHNAKYRGNFSPYIARNIIQMYSEPGEWVLDQMVGSGTTLIEAKLLHRNGVGFDINPASVDLALDGLAFEHETTSRQRVQVGDARALDELQENCVDLILTHPPYLDIIKYSKGSIPGDLSNISNVKTFCEEIEKVAAECFRVLKPDRYCAILIGDTRKARHYVPLSYFVMQRFLKAGFVLKEDIIKVQHNCSATKRWEAKAREMKFYLIMHEHLYVFRKPKRGELLTPIRWSARQA